MTRSRLIRLILNIVSLKIGWLSCVLGAANDRPWLGVFVVSVLTLVHFAVERRPQEIVILIAAAGLGFVVDSALVAADVLEFTHRATSWPVTAPWMVALWINLGTSMTVTMAYFQQHLVPAAVVGAISGPFAYFAGESLGAITIGDPRLTSALAIGAAWLVSFPLLAVVARGRGRDDVPVARPVEAVS